MLLVCVAFVDRFASSRCGLGVVHMADGAGRAYSRRVFCISYHLYHLLLWSTGDFVLLVDSESHHDYCNTRQNT